MEKNGACFSLTWQRSRIMDAIIDMTTPVCTEIAVCITAAQIVTVLVAYLPKTIDRQAFPGLPCAFAIIALCQSRPRVPIAAAIDPHPMARSAILVEPMDSHDLRNLLITAPSPLSNNTP